MIRSASIKRRCLKHHLFGIVAPGNTEGGVDPETGLGDRRNYRQGAACGISYKATRTQRQALPLTAMSL